ncbi:aminoglycoside phosphotransferase family protein [Actinoplanes couchii]|uniref:Aminoglycoside O-phosphotransferase n=1 Tax=Actinoplanes couchii TaxID=403638 RepID=A0ABQ3XKP9_9ACTN|nr:aminoglycoside phosphotransferase family protein [Actinoplanes couchii]MDR6319535.1 streptomycin 6-kinase [Actinoplanes couchii]GID59075.1 aminoglycoside O-phosphotransferase [Actinoplanes couchii]
MIPPSFRDMPRWWRDGTRWLDALPGLVRAGCDRWRLTVAGEAMHGSNALVVPVTRDGDEFVLRLSPPGPDVGRQAAALRFWDGRGTARLIDVHDEDGAMLLERLRPGTSLEDVPAEEAVHVLCTMMRRLAVPGPPDVTGTSEAVARRMGTMEREWVQLGRPFPDRLLREALDIGVRLSEDRSGYAVDGDLHSGQVLRAGREDWLVVDPVLLRGEIDYDLGRVLWTRLDDMATPADIVRHFDVAVTAAGTERDRSRDWVVFRTADYWLWGLSAGLTEDPQRCARLSGAL